MSGNAERRDSDKTSVDNTSLLDDDHVPGVPPPVVSYGATSNSPAKEPISPLSPAVAPKASTWQGDPRLEFVVGIVNRKSGERSAAEHVFQNMRELLGADRVIDLTGDLFRDPTYLMDMIGKHAVIPGARAAGNDHIRGTVVVSGGDGTVSFVMGVIDKLSRGCAPGRTRDGGMTPAVAVLALGTGNDLSNSLGFGNGYTKNKLCCCCVCLPNDIVAHANNAIAAPPVAFDRWKITMEKLSPSGATMDTTELLSNNYFSLGMDAFIATTFDTMRKKYPAGFKYRTMNKMWYGNIGVYGWIKCTRLNDYVTVNVDGKATALPKRSKAVIASNLNSYSGGGKLWVKPSGGLTPVNINDGVMEVQAVGGMWDMGLLQLKVGGGAGKMAQGKKTVFTVHGPDCAAVAKGVVGQKLPSIALQVDGEPAGFVTGHTRITIEPHDVVGFVRCSSKDVVGFGGL